ncbi:MAG: BPSS1780 family membrane protein [Pseudomonadota bacterium]
MTDNPYAAPEANVDAPPPLGNEHRLNDPRSVPAGRGWEWIAGGFRYFAANPLQWILALLAWFAVLIGLSLLPLINLVTSVITPVMVGGYMMGCDAEDRGEGFEVSRAFSGFQQSTTELFIAGALYLLGTIVLVVIAMVLIFVFGGAGALAVAAGGDAAGGAIALGGIAIAVLLTVGLSVPLLMAFYFVPPLIALAKMKPVPAIKLSFVACLRNILPFLVFGLILMVLSVLAIIPLFMGFLVLAPVMIASVYTAYKDIFLLEDTAPLGPAR